MTLKYYNSSLSISTTPQEKYKSDLQSFIDAQFDNAPNVYDIDQELTYGLLNWSPTKVRIDRVISSKTDEKLENDYKQFIFQDLSHPRGLGYRYLFKNETYLTIDTDSLSITPSIIVRRCNQTLRWEDTVNRTTIQQSCVVANAKVRNFDVLNEDKYLIMPDGKLIVITQYNTDTKTIKYNQKFMFNSQVYEVVGIDNVTNVINEQGLLHLTMQKTTKNNADDFITQTADNSGLTPTVPTGDSLW